MGQGSSLVVTWGNGASGRLGHGDSESRQVPTPVVLMRSRGITGARAVRAPSPTGSADPYFCFSRSSASGSASTPASARWSAVIGVGAPVSGSPPEAVLGKAMTSRMVG